VFGVFGGIDMRTNTNLDEAHRDDITIGEESMAQVVRPGLQIGHLIPDFRLETADGRIISPSDYKERKNLVLLFFNPRDSRDLEVLVELARRYPSLSDANAEVLGIASGPINEFRMCSEHLKLPYPLLSDVRKEAICSYCVEGMMIFVADEYGELRLQSEISEDNLDKVLDEVESTLGLVEIECPECGVATWPMQ
jgi:peroxiredoxin